jgi:hypothetical protein
MSQRDFMRELVSIHGRVRDVVIRAYAAGERRGRVRRRSNKWKLGAEVYAARLWEDGVRKGWLFAE